MNPKDTSNVDELLDGILNSLDYGYAYRMSDYATGKEQENEYEREGLADIEKAKTAIKALIDEETRRAETLMGDAIIARHRQANYQWEKTESFISSYPLQKSDDVHGIFKQLKEREG